MHAPPQIRSNFVNFSVYATGLDEDRFEYDPSLLLGQRLESRQCICVNELELLQCEQFLQLDWCAGCADERNVFDRGWSTNCLKFLVRPALSLS